MAPKQTRVQETAGAPGQLSEQAWAREPPRQQDSHSERGRAEELELPEPGSEPVQRVARSEPPQQQPGRAGAGARQELQPEQTQEPGSAAPRERAWSCSLGHSQTGHRHQGQYQLSPPRQEPQPSA